MTTEVRPVRFVTDEGTMTEIATLEPHPENPNVGDPQLIAESIAQNGFYGSIIVQQSTRRVIAGWHRVQALKLLGESRVPVSWARVDDEAALRILAHDNAATRAGRFDQAKLADILEELQPTDAGLKGSGFTNDDLARMLRETDRWGDKAAGFLGGEDEPPAPGGPAAQPEPPDPGDRPEWVALSYSVSPSQRDDIQLAIREAKVKLGDSRESPVTSGDALAAICEWWRMGE